MERKALVKEICCFVVSTRDSGADAAPEAVRKCTAQGFNGGVCPRAPWGRAASLAPGSRSKAHAARIGRHGPAQAVDRLAGDRESHRRGAVLPALHAQHGVAAATTHDPRRI